MKCPLCQVEMGQSHPIYKVSLVNGEPKLYLEHELKCRSKQCANYGKVVTTIRNEQTNVQLDDTEDTTE